MKRPSMQIGLGIALGIAIGAAVALILGSGGAWLTVGIVVGVMIGKAMPRSGHAHESAQSKSRFLTAKAVRNDTGLTYPTLSHKTRQGWGNRIWFLAKG